MILSGPGRGDWLRVGFIFGNNGLGKFSDLDNLGVGKNFCRLGKNFSMNSRLNDMVYQ